MNQSTTHQTAGTTPEQEKDVLQGTPAHQPEPLTDSDLDQISGGAPLPKDHFKKAPFL